MTSGAVATLGTELGKAWALVRVTALTEMSYRLKVLLSLGAVLFTLIPLFFVAEALQPVAAESIRDEGERYFGFLVLGLATATFIGVALRGVDGFVSSGISSGTLETLFTTPTRIPVLLAGMVGYPLIRTSVQAGIMLLAVVAAGTPVFWASLPLGLLILALLILSYLAVGLMAAALHLVFRTSGPITSATLALSTLLGGVYYSTTVIPDIIQPLAHVIPLTYGLRALRRTLLQGASLGTVGVDLVILLAFTAVLLAIGATAFRLGLRYARKAGTLAQY
jgi:ABC-2 type transport system permease protein